MPLLCSLPSWFLLCLSRCRLALGLPHPTPPSWFMGAPSCLGKYTYSPLRTQCDRCLGEVTRGRLPCLPPSLFAFCPHSLNSCFAVNWYLPSILNIAYRQVNGILGYTCIKMLLTQLGNHSQLLRGHDFANERQVVCHFDI